MYKIKAIVLPFVLFALCIVLPSKIITESGDYAFALYDKNGVLTGASVAKDGQWRFEKGDIPEKFKKSIILFEDRRFYSHHGIDALSVLRAAYSDIKARKIVSGGSTITMQLARILNKSPRRTFIQKGVEALEALYLEALFTKDEIISMYAANAPFGGNVVGIEAASWRYFNRPPDSLSWAEYATLAVLPNQPSLVRPGENAHILQSKRDRLLYRLYKTKSLTVDEYNLAISEALPEKPYPLPLHAPHYLEAMKKQNPGKSKFYTSLDLQIQLNVSRIIEKWSDEFAERGINNAAVIVIDNDTLEPLAYCANTAYSSTGRNKNTYAVDMIKARRSSGSILKPFLFSAMLESGNIINTQALIDIPTRVGSYKPENNIVQYRGIVSANEALTRSLNIPAIRALRTYGIARFLNFIKAFGITTLDRSAGEYGLPLILGGGEVTLEEITKAYALLIRCAKGDETSLPISRGAAYLTLNALVEGIRPEGETLWKFYAKSRKIAWKTGTSNGYRDAWAVGTTSEYTVGVWIGNAEGAGAGELASITTSAPVLFDIYSSLPPTHWIEKPYLDLENITVCAYSGYLAGPFCAKTKKSEKCATAPLSPLCPYCDEITLTPDKKYRATIDDMKGEYEGLFPIREKFFILPPSVEYWYARTATLYKKLPPPPPWHEKPQNAHLSIMFPVPNAQIIIPTEINGKMGSTVFQVAQRDKSAVVFWDLDGEYLGLTRGNHEMAVSPSEGVHTLTVTDSFGTRRQVTFTAHH